MVPSSTANRLRSTAAPVQSPARQIEDDLAARGDTPCQDIRIPAWKQGEELPPFAAENTEVILLLKRLVEGTVVKLPSIGITEAVAAMVYRLIFDLKARSEVCSPPLACVASTSSSRRCTLACASSRPTPSGAAAAPPRHVRCRHRRRIRRCRHRCFRRRRRLHHRHRHTTPLVFCFGHPNPPFHPASHSSHPLTQIRQVPHNRR